MANVINAYHDCINEFNLNYPECSNDQFRIAQWNIRGMNDLRKFDNIQLFFESTKVPIDVFVVGETWLKSSNSGLYNITDFNAVFSCRETSSGGLAVYIKSGLSFAVLNNVSCDGFHLIHIEVKKNGIYYEVVGLYRPPSFDFYRFHEEIENILSVQNSRLRFIVGDINIPVNLSNNNVVVRYKNLLESYNYSCSNTFVTRPISNNILDHLVCNNDVLGRIRNDTIFTDVSDHLPIVSSLEIYGPKESVILTKQIIDRDKMNALFTQFLNNFVCGDNVNDSISTITNTYSSILEQCTKIKSEQVNFKSKYCPWLNHYVWQWIKLKRKYRKKNRKVILITNT